MQLAAIQMHCSDTYEDNIARATALVADAASQGAEFVVLPELFAALHRRSVMKDRAESIAGPTMQWALDLARTAGVHLIPGSFVELEGNHLYNTSCLISNKGALVATYRKIHLFDVDLEGATSRESDTFTAGSSTSVGKIDDATIGLTICYDLRFPELFRSETLQGATLIAVPSAFTATTGRDHWELLLRARAVENQIGIVAAAQCGVSPDGIERHGHALIIDAWGRVLADAGADGDNVIIATIPQETIADIRRRLPSLTHRQPAAYN